MGQEGGRLPGDGKFMAGSFSGSKRAKRKHAHTEGGEWGGSPCGGESATGQDGGTLTRNCASWGGVRPPSKRTVGLYSPKKQREPRVHKRSTARKKKVSREAKKTNTSPEARKGGGGKENKSC